MQQEKGELIRALPRARQIWAKKRNALTFGPAAAGTRPKIECCGNFTSARSHKRGNKSVHVLRSMQEVLNPSMMMVSKCVMDLNDCFTSLMGCASGGHGHESTVAVNADLIGLEPRVCFQSLEGKVAH